MLETAMFIGLSLVAVWAYVRFPRLRPGSLMRAVVHVVVSFVVFALLPATLGLVLPAAPSPGLVPYVVLALLIPSLTYLTRRFLQEVHRQINERRAPGHLHKQDQCNKEGPFPAVLR